MMPYIRDEMKGMMDESYDLLARVKNFGVNTMLHYPKMPGSKNCPDGKCWAFEKYDGTNLH